MNSQAKKLVDDLKLKPHEEGGYFAETYRSEGGIPASALPDCFEGSRVFSTSIYFLLPSGEVSKFHRMKSDEVWHFYSGSPLEIFMLSKGSGLVRKVLDPASLSFQVNVPSGVWLGARVLTDNSYSLVGCTVAPGFEFSDFELGRRDELLRDFPEQGSLVLELT